MRWKPGPVHRGMLIATWIVAIGTANAAAGAGEPGSTEIRDAIQSRLDKTFGADLLRARKTEHIERQQLPPAGDSPAWLLVRYRTELKFLQDYRLSSARIEPPPQTASPSSPIREELEQRTAERSPPLPLHPAAASTFEALRAAAGEP